MRPDDYADERTEEVIARLEKRIREIFAEAAGEMQGTITEYFAKFKARDEAQRKLLEAGEITQEEYNLWRLAQIGRGERLEALRDKIAQRMTDAHTSAVEYINDSAPSVYALNRNYAAYEIETDLGREVFKTDEMRVSMGIDFILWDEHTVQRLIAEQPDLMPYYPEKKALDRGIDLAWGRKQITRTITAGILQGKSLKKLADDLQERIEKMDRESAIRTARTAMTTAQNAGRQDGYGSAARMGIDIYKKWIETKDHKTRHDHSMASGQTVPYNKPFTVGGYLLMFPGDRSLGAPGKEIYNCRCRTRTVEKQGIEAEPRMMRVRGPDGRNVVVNEMTYPEWKEWVIARGG